MEIVYNYNINGNPYFVRCGIAVTDIIDNREQVRYIETFHHDITAPLIRTEVAKFPLPLQSIILLTRLYPRIFKITPSSAVKITAMLLGRFFNSELFKMLNDAKYLESTVRELNQLMHCHPNRLCLLTALTDGPPEDHNQLIQELMLSHISQYYPDLAHGIFDNIRLKLDQSELVDLLLIRKDELTAMIHAQSAIINYQLGIKPLTLDVLDRASTRNRNEMVGACIFTLVNRMCPNMTTKIIDDITMSYSNSKLVSMLNNRKLLQSIITEIKVEMNQEPLSQSTLDAASPSEQKDLLGNKLYLLVHARYPYIAGKITGMLLGLTNDELFRMLNDREFRNSMTEEAVDTLATHKAKKAAESVKEAAEKARVSEDLEDQPAKQRNI